jgi:cytochrome o ubiquinol oxidase subunit 2
MSRLLSRRLVHAAAVSTLVLLLSGCASLSSGFLDPAGEIALRERQLFTVVGIVLIFVVGPVLLLTPLIAWHYRLANTKGAFRPDWRFSWKLEFLIWVPPTLIVVGLAVVLCNYTVRLDPYGPVPGASGKPLPIDVVSLDWKWLFIYPDQHIATVNQLMLPADRPVHMYLTSGTVMQSLLMPRVAGQIYAMAGMQTQLDFEISQPGTYWGENTQYNGRGFPRQQFAIHGMAAQSFVDWVKHAQANPAALDAKAYESLSKESVLKRVRTYGQVQSGLYQLVLHQKITPGYVPQHHEPLPAGSRNPTEQPASGSDGPGPEKHDIKAPEGRSHA